VASPAGKWSWQQVCRYEAPLCTRTMVFSIAADTDSRVGYLPDKGQTQWNSFSPAGGLILVLDLCSWSRDDG
jgi:hypothetical protein